MHRNLGDFKYGTLMSASKMISDGLDANENLFLKYVQCLLKTFQMRQRGVRLQFTKETGLGTVGKAFDNQTENGIFTVFL